MMQGAREALGQTILSEGWLKISQMGASLDTGIPVLSLT